MAINLKKSKTTTIQINSKTWIQTDKPVSMHADIVKKYKRRLELISDKTSTLPEINPIEFHLSLQRFSDGYNRALGLNLLKYRGLTYGNG